MGTISKKDAILYGIDGDWSITEFDFVNNRLTDVVFDAFDPNTLVTFSTVFTGAPDFFILGSTDYNYWLRDTLYSPALIRRIIFYSNNARNFNQVVNHTYKDATGLRVNSPLIPSLSVGMNQFQSGIGMLDFPTNEMILGVNEWLSNFLVRRQSQIKLILVYKQIDKSNLLTNKVKLTSIMDTNIQPVQLVSEKDLELTSTMNLFEYVPIISEKTYLFNDKKNKNLISPFDLNSFNGLFEQKKVKNLNGKSYYG